jgi:hypothetical protein
MNTRLNFNWSGWFSLLAVGLLLTGGCAEEYHGVKVEKDTGVRASDPNLIGPRIKTLDHLIVPANRVGPVILGGYVQDAIQHLGQPEYVWRQKFDQDSYGSVYYRYKDDCLEFSWIDSAVSPTVLGQIIVQCGKWATKDGVSVGMPLVQALQLIGRYCEQFRQDGIEIFSQNGLWLTANHRNDVVRGIGVWSVKRAKSACPDNEVIN